VKSNSKLKEVKPVIQKTAMRLAYEKAGGVINSNAGIITRKQMWHVRRKKKGERQ
tara:strand:- start:4897 stop:5061 length:165 start_codon:yes stop_codon:yes gene_type:complete